MILQISDVTAEVTEVGFAGFAMFFLCALIAFRVEPAQVFVYSCTDFTVFLDFCVQASNAFSEKLILLAEKARFSGYGLRACG